MNKILRKLLLPFALSSMVLVGAVGSVPTTHAANPLDQSCTGTLADTEVCRSRDEKLFGANSFWTRLINTMIFIVGTVAVLMMVIGGLRYVLSGGDASQTKSAKDTILYSIIGVVIALMAYAIVNFVVVELVG